MSWITVADKTPAILCTSPSIPCSHSWPPCHVLQYPSVPHGCNWYHVINSDVSILSTLLLRRVSSSLLMTVSSSRRVLTLQSSRRRAHWSHRLSTRLLELQPSLPTVQFHCSCQLNQSKWVSKILGGDQNYWQNLHIWDLGIVTLEFQRAGSLGMFLVQNLGIYWSKVNSVGNFGESKLGMVGT